jgi:hydrogenase nickel incorporation protein HypB
VLLEGPGHVHTHDGHTFHSHEGHEHLPDDHEHHGHEQRDAQTVSIERAILARNDAIAARNRALLEARGIVAFNLVSSPGSGKTTLLEKTLRRLVGRVPVAVIEGDQETSRDADRIQATGVPVLQINTGAGCHLDAEMVARALDRLRPEPNSLLFIENVGNLVCPALFDLGELAKVAVISVTEGDDKPLKYPHMFRASQVLIVNKLDLLPYVEFDVDRAVSYARRLHPETRVFPLSATRGDGLDGWVDWLLSRVPAHDERLRSAT